MPRLFLRDSEVLSLVLCAFQAAEIESAYDLAEIEQMPSPFPEVLQRVRDRKAHWNSLDFPYDTYPDGWEVSLQT